MVTIFATSTFWGFVSGNRAKLENVPAIRDKFSICSMSVAVDFSK